MLNYINRRFFYLQHFYSNRIPTHLTIEEKIKLLELARQTSGSFVEIGSYLGASACFIAEGIINSNKQSYLFCVDTWENDAMSEGHKDTYKQFMENTSRYCNVIRPLRGQSYKVAETFEKKIDFLFIDGDHSYDGVKLDVDSWFPMLNPGALVILHDAGWAEGVKKVIREDVAPRVIKEGCLPNLYWAWIK